MVLHFAAFNLCEIFIFTVPAVDLRIHSIYDQLNFATYGTLYN